MTFVTFSLQSYYVTGNPGEVHFWFGISAGNIAVANEVKLFLKKFQFSLMSLEFGFMWKYVVVS